MKQDLEQRLRQLEESHPGPDVIIYRVGNPVWMEIECRIGAGATVKRFFRDDGSIEDESVILEGGAGSMRVFAPDGAVIEEVPLLGGMRIDQHPEATRASFQQDRAVQQKVEQIRDSGTCRDSESNRKER